MPKEIRKIMSHHSSLHPRQPVEFLVFSVVDFGIRIICIRIIIILPTFEQYV